MIAYNFVVLLNGWKAIAGYMSSGVRSARHWEQAGLPVHRSVLSRRSHVFAYSEEIERWVQDSVLEGGEAVVLTF